MSVQTADPQRSALPAVPSPRDPLGSLKRGLLTLVPILQAVLTEFGFKPFKKHKVELLDMLNMFLIEQYANDKKVVLIVDEAQNLSLKVLEEIRMLSNIETHKEKVLRIILAGQPELREKLDSPKLKQLAQRVRLRFHLGALDRQDMRKYIKHRLKVAGAASEELIASDAMEVIFRYTGGVPRLINTLCDTALLCAFADNKPRATLDDVMAAVTELDWDEHESNTGVFQQLQEMASRRPGTESHVMQIEVRAHGETESIHTFPEGRVIVGRSPDNEIYIKSKFVSRHHMQFICDAEGCVVEDLNSTNGVFIGEVQVKKRELASGDVITLGVHELVYTNIAVAAHQRTAEELDFEDTVDDVRSVVGEAPPRGHHRLDVAADVAHLGELRRLDLHER